MRFRLLCSMFTLALKLSSVVCETSTQIWVRHLVANLTRTEKEQLLNGENAFNQGYYVGNLPAIQRLDIPSSNLQDGPQGFRTTSVSHYGQVTSWPCSLLVSSSFSSTTMNDWASALGVEAKKKGVTLLLGPAVNLHRVGIGGRNAEYVTGEEPWLGKAMSAAYVKGLQSQGVQGNVKHFVLNNQETNRNTVNSVVDNRTLHELYLPPFIAAAEAGVASAMCSYNLVNSLYACAQPLTLNALKQVPSFTGYIMSDWGAVHGPASTYASAGLDVDMPGDDQHFSSSELAKLSDALVDEMATRILTPMMTVLNVSSACNTGSGGCDQALYTVNATSEEHVQLAHDIIVNSTQLLQNNNNVLPLNLKPGSTIGLVGSICNSSNNIAAMTLQWDLGNYYVLGGSGRVISPYTISILDGLTRRASDAQINVRIDTSDNVEQSLSFIDSVDVVIICGATGSTEGRDRSSLFVDNDAFITAFTDAVLAQETKLGVHVPSVVILNTPGSVMTDWRGKVDAVVNMFLAGQETGHAWASLLFGDASPGGKLPVTFPASASDLIYPCSDDSVPCPYSEGLSVGYRALHGRPVAYPFGHGLSYANFSLEWVSAPSVQDAENDDENDAITVHMSVRVTNHGGVSYDGVASQVVQVYVDFPSSADEPPNLLRAFTKVALTQGSSVVIDISLDDGDVSVWAQDANSGEGGWNLARGNFTIHVGFSSRDLPLEANFTL